MNPQTPHIIPTTTLAGLISAPIKQARERLSEERWDQMTRQSGKWVGILKAALQREFERQRFDVLSAIRRADIKPKKAFRREPLTLEEIYQLNTDRYNAGVQRAVQPGLRGALSDGAQQGLNTLGVGFSFDLSLPEVQQVIDDWSLRLAGNVNTTTLTSIQEELKAGMAAGEGTPELAARINRVFKEATVVRAALIGQTEAVRAANGGQVLAWKQTNVVVAKEWWASGDDLTCPFCASMHETVVWMDDTFLALGGSLDVRREDGSRVVMRNNYAPVDYPPLHPRCRCTLMPITRRMAADRGLEGKPPKVKPEIVEPKIGDKWLDGKTVVETKKRIKDTLGVTMVSLQGFSKKDHVRLLNLIGQELSRYYQLAPKLAEKMAAKSRRLSKLTIQNKEVLNGNVVGQYSSRSSFRKPTIEIASFDAPNAGTAITLGEFHSCADRFHTLRHEFGHHAHLDTFLTKKQKTGWAKIYENFSDSDKGRLISRYAAQNEKEFFAESFAAFYHPDYGSPGLPRLPKKIEDFIEDVLGKRPNTTGR